MTNDSMIYQDRVFDLSVILMVENFTINGSGWTLYVPLSVVDI